MSKHLESEITRQQPFRNIMTIVKIESLEGRGAISGEAFEVLASSGKKYKLRCCKTLKQAKLTERNVTLIPNLFPRFYGREGRYLLFDWINGEFLGKELSLDVCYKLGKMAGEAHALSEINKKKTPFDLFNTIITNLRTHKIFNNQILGQIEKTYFAMIEKLKPDIVLEFHDFHRGNILADKHGKLYFIDEEGFGYKVKGLGLAKPFFRSKWIKTSAQKRAFWKGYCEHHSNDYFDNDYKKFVHFLQLIRTISTRTRTGADYMSERKDLLNMLEKKGFFANFFS
ncbi:MAG: hypothetical protein ABIC91_06950 [Nanoarchaeota archaeon]|nr:aminoglycoside phosphotransferase family protein [Nanoarchaeota archaeon]MBU1849608.1 aminoglycoside phosphotransferase family protein [Nanoarchaeota archaeon]